MPALAIMFQNTMKWFDIGIHVRGVNWNPLMGNPQCFHCFVKHLRSKLGLLSFLATRLWCLLMTLTASMAWAVRPIWPAMTVLSKASITDIWKKNCFVPWIYPYLRSICQCWLERLMAFLWASLTGLHGFFASAAVVCLTPYRADRLSCGCCLVCNLLLGNSSISYSRRGRLRLKSGQLVGFWWIGR